MISYNNLGKYGRLGNQMFQYAALKGIAKNRGYDYTIPYSSGIEEYNDHRLFNVFKMYNTAVGVNHSPIFSERFFHFDKELFNTCPDNVDLHGYFQSYKYFDHIRDELLEDFSFKSSRLVNNSYVAVHVRRGDYVNQPDFHPVCDLEYYRKAMDYFKGESFLIFSDDPEWCRQQEVFSECHFSESNDQSLDLQDMSQAVGNIIANSSFSWWGAYLNKNSSAVICPKKWFGSAYAHYDMSDIRPENWIQL
jgi:hypothetical protein